MFSSRKPTDNPSIESFNESYWDECLNTNWFLSLADAMSKLNPLLPTPQFVARETPEMFEIEWIKRPENSTLDLSS